MSTERQDRIEELERKVEKLEEVERSIERLQEFADKAETRIQMLLRRR